MDFNLPLVSCSSHSSISVPSEYSVKSFFFFSFFFFFVALGFELRASLFLGECSYCLNPPPSSEVLILLESKTLCLIRAQLMDHDYICLIFLVGLCFIFVIFIKKKITQSSNQEYESDECGSLY
jgi:hypothetical protein